jgi:hypothetical protein
MRRPVVVTLQEKAICFDSCEKRCAPRLERRKELEEMAPLLAINTEITPSVACFFKGKGQILILTTHASFTLFVWQIIIFLLENAALVSWKMDFSRCPQPQWIGTSK